MARNRHLLEPRSTSYVHYNLRWRVAAPKHTSLELGFCDDRQSSLALLRPELCDQMTRCRPRGSIPEVELVLPPYLRSGSTCRPRRHRALLRVRQVREKQTASGMTFVPTHRPQTARARVPIMNPSPTIIRSLNPIPSPVYRHRRTIDVH